MSSDLLDHPIWSALATRQAHLAQSNARAKRYPTDVAPFAHMVDTTVGPFTAASARCGRLRPYLAAHQTLAHHSFRQNRRPHRPFRLPSTSG